MRNRGFQFGFEVELPSGASPSMSLSNMLSSVGAALIASGERRSTTLNNSAVHADAQEEVATGASPSLGSKSQAGSSSSSRSARPASFAATSSSPGETALEVCMLNELHFCGMWLRPDMHGARLALRALCRHAVCPGSILNTVVCRLLLQHVNYDVRHQISLTVRPSFA